MKRLDCAQGSEEWFEARLGIPTVSEFGRFITPARGDHSKQSDGYIADLIVESVEGAGERISSYWMDRGTFLEDEARSFYEFETDQDVTQVGLILNKGAGWSPDGEVGADGALEIKCPKASTHVKWLLSGGLPNEHWPQVYGAIVVGEKKWADFLSYCPGYKPLLVRVEPCDYSAKVEMALGKFLQDLAEAKAKVLA